MNYRILIENCPYKHLGYHNPPFKINCWAHHPKDRRYHFIFNLKTARTLIKQLPSFIAKDFNKSEWLTYKTKIIHEI